LYKGRITGRGFNQKKTHAKMNKDFGFYSLHAESAALLKAKQGDTVIVIRILRNGDLGCSKPCERCMKHMQERNIKEVYYINWSGEIVSEKI
jgi:deoxycytidylate deaminase